VGKLFFPQLCEIIAAQANHVFGSNWGWHLGKTRGQDCCCGREKRGGDKRMEIHVKI